MSNAFKFLSVIIMVCSLLLLFGCPSSEDTSKKEKYDIRKQGIEQRAPDFMLEDLKGNKVKLSDHKGKEILLVFSTTWCLYCRAEIPYLKKIYSKYKEKGLEIIHINIQESREKVSSYAIKYQLPYKVLLDIDGKVASIYGVRGVPTKVLIGQDGTILCVACRSIDIMLDMLFGTPA